jgi:hypothetical protein
MSHFEVDLGLNKLLEMRWIINALAQMSNKETKREGSVVAVAVSGVNMPSLPHISVRVRACLRRRAVRSHTSRVAQGKHAPRVF